MRHVQSWARLLSGRSIAPIARGAVLGGLVLLTGCAHALPKSDNPHFRKVGSLWYCYGVPWAGWSTVGATYIDDHCRIDPCEMHMPAPECLPMGVVPE